MDVDGPVVICAGPGAMVDEDGVASPAESGAEPTVDTEGWSDDDRRAEADSRSDNEAGPRRVEDNGGAIDRNVYVSGINGLNFNVATVVDDVVVGCGGEIAVVVGGLALALDGVHNVISLNEDGVAEVAGPLWVARHHIEDGGKGQEGEDAGVPGELVSLNGLSKRVSGQVRVLLGPGCGVRDLLPKG